MLRSLNVSMEDIKYMFYRERCEVLIKSVVLVSRYFQYQVKVLFQFIVLNGPLGKTQYYTIPAKFEVKSSFYIH